MPERDGFELLRELRRTTPGLKVVAISGGGQVESSEYLLLARELGAVATLSKPFRPSELLQAVADALGAARP